MKGKWALGLTVLLGGLLFAGSAFAIPTYNMTVTNGMVYTGASAVGNMNNDLPRTGQSIPSNFGGLGTFDIAGWWEFAVTGSTANTPGSNWNEVFAGGTWYFQTKWDGSVQAPTGDWYDMPTAQFNQYGTWAGMYNQWFENNPNCYTYFSLYVDPASGGASTPGTAPIGVFAFVADSATANFGNTTGLMSSPVWVVGDGDGLATATRVPEPATMLLLGLGLMGIAGIRRKS